MNAQTEQQRSDFAKVIIENAGALEVRQWEHYLNEDLAAPTRPVLFVNAIRALAQEFVDTIRAIGDERVRSMSIGQLRFLVERFVQIINVCMSALDVYRGRVAAGQSGSAEQWYNELANTIQPNLDALVAQLPFLRALRSAKTDELSEFLLGELDEAKTRFDDLSAATEGLLKQLRESALLVGVAKQGRSFREAQKTHEEDGRRWLIAAVIAALILVTTVAALAQCAGPPFANQSWVLAGNLRYFAGRALLLSCLSFAAVVCLRNYRAARHNEIMNAHRARALSTFEEFRSAAEGPASDVMLVQASSAIFGVQPSGFADTDGSGATHLQELAAAVGVKKG